MDIVHQQLDRGIGRYVTAIHFSRIAIAAVSILVAATTLNEIQTAPGYALAVPIVGLVWMTIVCAGWGWVRDRMMLRPWLIWIDPVVLLSLMLLNKPWDSLIVLPYCSFVLLVPFVRPRAMVTLVAVATVLQYVPKLVLTLAAWRFAPLVPPVTTTDWLTMYVGPLFCGTVAWALCLLAHGIRREIHALELAGRQLVATRAEASRLIARQHLANRLHETLSQVVRAIPLRLDGPPPAGLGPQALATRSAIIDLARDVRPTVQQVARDLKRPPDVVAPSGLDGD